MAKMTISQAAKEARNRHPKLFARRFLPVPKRERCQICQVFKVRGEKFVGVLSKGPDFETALARLDEKLEEKAKAIKAHAAEQFDAAKAAQPLGEVADE